MLCNIYFFIGYTMFDIVYVVRVSETQMTHLRVLTPVQSTGQKGPFCPVHTVCTASWYVIAFITSNSNLVPLLEGQCVWQRLNLHIYLVIYISTHNFCVVLDNLLDLYFIKSGVMLNDVSSRFPRRRERAAAPPPGNSRRHQHLMPWPATKMYGAKPSIV